LDQNRRIAAGETREFVEPCGKAWYGRNEFGQLFWFGSIMVRRAVMRNHDSRPKYKKGSTYLYQVAVAQPRGILAQTVYFSAVLGLEINKFPSPCFSKHFSMSGRYPIVSDTNAYVTNRTFGCDGDMTLVATRERYPIGIFE
jgi:hypothetical protein